ncbi:MAG: PspA/IM30 family protein [Pseudomonadota bacterium]
MIRTLTTLFRARAADAEDALIDANGTTLLAQHLRDAKANVTKGQQTCAALMARKSAEEKRLQSLITEIEEREKSARDAIKAEETEPAAEIADRIIALEDHKDLALKAIADLEQRIAKIREGLSSAERRISTLAAELRMARSGAQSRKVMAQLSGGPDQCALHLAEDMAARVRGVNDAEEDICSAMDELRADPGGLDARIKGAGLTTESKSRRNALLARLSSDQQTNQ